MKSSSAQAQLFGANSSIRYSILFRIAFSNLFYKKLRTTLTIIGVVVGIGAIIFLLAFGYGLRNLVTSQLVDSNSIRTIDVNLTNPLLESLDSNMEQEIEHYNDVEEVSRVFNFAGEVEHEGATAGVVLFGTDQLFLDLSSFAKVAGPNIALENKSDAIVNTSFLKSIGIKNPQKLLNKKLNLTITVPEILRAKDDPETIKEQLKVISVIESGSGSEIYVSQKMFIERNMDIASQAKVLVKSKEAVPGLQKRIETLGFVTASPYDTVEQIDNVFRIMNYVFLGFGGIGLIIAVLGMFNTLTITLLERTKEIGLMRTLGARKKDIKRLFIIESIGLSFLGGSLGVFSAFILSFIINRVLNNIAHSRGFNETISAFSFHFSLVGSIMVFSTLLGACVVYFPARRASNMSAIDAMKG